MALITVAQAIAHLKISLEAGGSPPDPAVTDLELKMESATAIVLKYIKKPLDHWVLGGSPDPLIDIDFLIVQAAILETLGDLFFHRGDEDDNFAADPALSVYPKPNVQRMLIPLKDPTLA